MNPILTIIIVFLILLWIKSNLHELSHYLKARKYKLNHKYSFLKMLFWPFNISIDDKIKTAKPIIKVEILMSGLKTDSITLLFSIVIWFYIRNNKILNIVFMFFIFIQAFGFVLNLFFGDYYKLKILLDKSDY